MSSGTRDEKSIPRLPRDPTARSLLENWAIDEDEAHLYATQADFSDADLSGLQFYHFFGNECSFRGATLRRTGLAGGYLPDCDFTGADLTEALLPKAQLYGTVFDRATMSRCNLLKVEAEAASFARATLTEARIGGVLYRTKFTEADLRGVQFAIAGLRGADLRWADVEGCHGDIVGPVMVVDDGAETSVEGVAAEAWFRAHGAQVQVGTRE